jgi:hypothetical protein
VQATNPGSHQAVERAGIHQERVDACKAQTVKVVTPLNISIMLKKAR